MPVGCLGNSSGGGGSGSPLQNGGSVPAAAASAGSPGGPRCSPGGFGGKSNGMEIIVTSSILNSTEKFAFMQQTLLLQIFRQPPAATLPATGYVGNGTCRNGRQNGSVSPNSVASSRSSSSTGGGSSGWAGTQFPPSNGSDLSAMANGLNCPTCVAFNDKCCQVDSGLALFQEFQTANLQCCWDSRLSEAVASLRYQGYVCPGILVVIANSTNLEVVADAWKRRLLTQPANSKISQVGLSNGCVVKPVMQTLHTSLPDVLCLILARMRFRQVVANMDTICQAIERDWSSSSVSRILLDGGKDSLQETVHAALGGLIKQRKVYYTGNKGYFLVGPSDPGSAGATAASSASPLSLDTIGSNGSVVAMGFGCIGSQLRHSMRSRSSSWGKKSPTTPPQPSASTSASTGRTNDKLMIDRQVQTFDRPSPNHDEVDVWVPLGGGQSSPHLPATPGEPLYSTPVSKERRKDGSEAISPTLASNRSTGDEGHGSSTPSGTHSLERSQSLRISKKSASRNMAKGGSLRLSKREAERLKAEQEDDDDGAEGSGATLGNGAKSSASATTTGGALEQQSDPSAQQSLLPKPQSQTKVSFERKNSFLGKLFSGSSSSRKAKNSASGAAASAVVSSEGQPSRNQPKMGTFSAQFPPPELLEMANPIYTALIKRPRAAARTEANVVPDCRAAAAATSQQGLRQGPNGNFVMVERATTSGSVATEPTPNGGPYYGGQSSYYQAVANGSVLYGYAVSGVGRPPPPPPGGHHLPGGHHPPHPHQHQAHYHPQNGLPRPPADILYSNPPPPLPYRPPPPNPYLFQKDRGGNEEAQQGPRDSGASPHGRGQHLATEAQSARTRNVRFADESFNGVNGNSSDLANSLSSNNSNVSNNSSSNSSNSNSGPSSVESQVRPAALLRPPGLGSPESLIVIERGSLNEELKWNNRSGSCPQGASRGGTASASIVGRRLRAVDTIHNNRNLLTPEEVIYEMEVPSVGQKLQVTKEKPRPKLQQGQGQDLQELPEQWTVSRSSSQSTLKAQASEDDRGPPGVAPSFPSLSDLSTIVNDVGSVTFKSLTAQKLVAGLTFNSVDTLLEVNAAAEARNRLNESTETIDFGVI